MKPISLSQIRRIVSGKMLAPAVDEAAQIQSVSHDSRKIARQSLFVAIVGENFDGHDFVARAAEAGAIAAIVQRPIENPPAGMLLIQVPSTRAAMGTLARYVRDHLKSKVIAVAGSNGKTSTKHLIHDAIGERLRGSMSPKSFNNDIGVPVTLFAANPADDFIILEMGTNHPGEIRTLTQIGAPDIAVLTCCGEEHLEFLGDIDGVCRENGSIVQGMNKDGLLIVNGDDPRLLAAVSRFAGDRITFGFGPDNDLVAADVRCGDDGTRFKLNGGREYWVPLLGRHSAANALAAIAVARRVGISESEIADNLARATGPEMRLQLSEICGVRILNDAYNANPGSVESAIETFKLLHNAGRKIAVMGEMRELGPTSDHHHRAAGRLAAGARPDVLVCVGAQAKLIAESAKDAGLPADTIRWFADATSAAAVVPEWLRTGDLVLLKASRGVRLEMVYQAIAARQ